MTPIALYPSDASHKKSGALGLLFVVAGYQMLTWAPDMQEMIPYAVMVIGLFLLAQLAVRVLNPTPVFEADAEGFSVMGKRKQGWDAFRGTKIYTARVGLFPAGTWVVVKTGKSVLGRKINIKWTHLSGPAKEMAREIEEYALAARIDAAAHASGVLDGVSNAGSQRAVSPEPMAQAVRAGAVGDGPVQSQPTMGERLFGRRKVI